MLFCKCYFHHNANICWAPPRRNDNKCVKRYLQLDRYLYCLNWKHLEYTSKFITSLCFCATSLIILFFMWHRSRFQEIYWCLESVYEMWFFRSRCNARACLLVLHKKGQHMLKGFTVHFFHGSYISLENSSHLAKFSSSVVSGPHCSKGNHGFEFPMTDDDVICVRYPLFLG